MKKILFLMLALIAAMSVKAQKITVLDNDGNGIPYATVLNSEGEFLGTTSLEGVLADAKGAIHLLGGKLESTNEFVLPGTDVSRTICVVKKVEPTSKKYPRKAGVPSKQPLK